MPMHPLSGSGTGPVGPVAGAGAQHGRMPHAHCCMSMWREELLHVNLEGGMTRANIDSHLSCCEIKLRELMQVMHLLMTSVEPGLTADLI